MPDLPGRVLHVDGRGPVRQRAAGAAHGHREAAHAREHLGLLLLPLLPNHHQALTPRCVSGNSEQNKCHFLWEK